MRRSSGVEVRRAGAPIGESVAAPVEREIRRFLAHVRAARFLGGLCEALLVVILGLATVLWALRLFGVSPEPSPWWALLALPAVAWAALCVRRLGFGRRAGALHLDRRLGLDGLLVTALERDTTAYDGRLRAKLQQAGAAQPHLHARPVLIRLGVAALMLLVVLLLPAPTTHARADNPIVAETLAEYEEKLAALEQNEGVQEEVREELTQRLEDLKDRFQKSGEMTWKDLDALQDTLEHEQALQAARLAKSQQDLAAFARGDDEQSAAGASAAAKRMADLLKDAQAAGLLDKLPEELRKQLGQGMDGAGLEGALDANAMKQLAAALAQAAGDKLSALEGTGLPEGIDPASLGELLAGTDVEALFGKPCKLCAGGKLGKQGDKDCPG